MPWGILPCLAASRTLLGDTPPCYYLPMPSQMRMG